MEKMEAEAMRPHGYHLQYYIYSVALKRWLEQTQKNFDFKKQFGGVYYIFIRGVECDPNNFAGIYFSEGKGLADSIEKLDELFKGEDLKP
jgi:exodeoxyribonuclease V beta subunit